MPVIESKLDPRDATFVKNREAMVALIADLRTRVAQIEKGGGEAACAKHVASKIPIRMDELLQTGERLLCPDGVVAY